VAKTKPSSRTIPKPRHVRRSPLTRVDVTRAEHDRVVDILNERNVILNALRDAVNELRRVSNAEVKRNDRLESAVDQLTRASEVQFKRIAQLQAEFDIAKVAGGAKRALT
jgi:arginine deiminase